MFIQRGEVVELPKEDVSTFRALLQRNVTRLCTSHLTTCPGLAKAKISKERKLT